MAALARTHHVTCVAGVGPEFDPAVAAADAHHHCTEAILVPLRRLPAVRKRLLQLRLLVSGPSLERHLFAVPELQRRLDGLLQARAYDAVVVEFPFVAHLRLRQAPAGARPPVVVVDQHNIEHDLSRQSRGAGRSFVRWLHHSVNWRKLLREEKAAWRDADGVAFTSPDDQARAAALVPSLRGRVVSNGVDVEEFRPRPDLPAPDGQTVVFFGTMAYFPNHDGMSWFLAEIWPRLSRTNPRVRLKVIGANPSPEVLRHRGPRVEVTGLVDDLRPHLAGAAAVIVPLRVGGGTRFKIIEAMAMGKPVVSTTLGAEGIAAAPGREIVIADGAERFADEVARLVEDPALAARIGAAARGVAERTYSWSAVAGELERFLVELREPQPSDRSAAAPR
jgi:glycosyltransferase involved in cell wall biosynthesis